MFGIFCRVVQNPKHALKPQLTMRISLPKILALLCLLAVACQNKQPPKQETGIVLQTDDKINALLDEAEALRKEDPDAAIRIYRQAADSALKKQRWEDWVAARRGIAKASLLTSEFLTAPDRVIDTLLRDLTVVPASYPHLKGAIHLEIGYTYKDKTGDYRAARAHYEIARQIHDSVGQVVVMAGNNLYKPLANIYTRLGEYPKAVALLNKAWDTSLAENDAIGQANISNDLYLAYKDIGEKDTLSFFLKRGLDYLNTWQPDNEDEVKRQNNARGLLLSSEADRILSEADEQYQLSGKLPDRSAMLGARSNISSALEITRRKDYLAAIWGLEAQACFLGGDQPGMHKALDSAEFYTQAYYGQRLMQREIGKFYIARNQFLQESGHTPTEVLLQNCMRALEAVMPAFHPKDPLENPPFSMIYPENTILEALDLKSDITWHEYLRSGNTTWLHSSAETAELALAAADSLIQLYGYDNSVLLAQEATRNLHERYIQILMEQLKSSNDPNITEKLFIFFEKSRAVILHQKLAEGAALTSGSIPASWLDRESALRARILFLRDVLIEQSLDNQPPKEIKQTQQQIFQAEELHMAFRDSLKTIAPAYFNLKYGNAPAALTATQNFLKKEDAALVEYFYNPATGALYGIGVDASQVHTWKNSLALKDLESFLAFIRDDSLVVELGNSPVYAQKITMSARMLYDSLLRPFTGGRAFPRLVISPDGILGSLPFDVLMREESSATQALPYLVYETAVRLTPSISLLMSTDLWERHDATTPYLGIAPEYHNAPNFEQILHGRGTVQKLATLFGGTYFTGKLATADHFIEEGQHAQILHFYGHGQADLNNPMLSWLAFSPELSVEQSKAVPTLFAKITGLFLSGPQQKLTAAERRCLLYAHRISASAVHAELSVLSACETGLGKTAGAEGVLSIARAFQDAGCPSVALTLWRVKDDVTAEISTQFLTNVNQGMALDEALRQAKIAYLNSNPRQPFFWGAFVLAGKSQPLKMIAGSPSIHLPERAIPWLPDGLLFVGLLLLVAWLLTIIFRHK